jgi:probable HAF family extracellular repeat protein
MTCTRKRLACLSHLAGAVALAALSTVCLAQTYTITDLGTITKNSDSYSAAKGVNATAEVTGAASSNGDGGSEVFTWSDGVMTGLGTLGGNSGIGNGINASGQVAGYAQNSAGTYRAFLATNGVLTDIGDLGGGSAVAYGLNDSGQVVGSAVTADGSNHPFLYSNGVMTDLGTLGSPNGNAWWNSAQGVNKSGVVTGTSYDAQGNFFAFSYSNGKMTQMGTLGGSWSQGYAINNRGQVAGLAYTKSGAAHAFLANCATCTLKDLDASGGDTTTSWGFAINDSGVVVGQFTAGGGYHAFVYSGGKFQDLNKLIPAGTGWMLVEANGINASGQIGGLGTIKNAEHAYLLTPR